MAVPVDRISALVARFLGVFLLLGGMGELVTAVGHVRVSALFGVLHGDATIRAWVGVQAVVSIALGVGLLRSARGLSARTTAAMRRARGCVLAFFGLIVVSQILLAWRLYPQLLDAPPPEPFAGFWVLSMAVAPLGPAVMGGVLLLRLRAAK